MHVKDPSIGVGITSRGSGGPGGTNSKFSSLKEHDLDKNGNDRKSSQIRNKSSQRNNSISKRDVPIAKIGADFGSDDLEVRKTPNNRNSKGGSGLTPPNDPNSNNKTRAKTKPNVPPIPEKKKLVDNNKTSKLKVPPPQTKKEKESYKSKVINEELAIINERGSEGVF